MDRKKHNRREPSDWALYIKYFPLYAEIQKHSYSRYAMRNHPGAKFMRRMTWKIIGILWLIACIGNILRLLRGEPW